MNGAKRTNPVLLALLLTALTPVLAGFLCFPLVPPPPSGVVTPVPAAVFAPTVSASVANTTPNAQSNVSAQLSIPAGSTLAIGVVFDVPAGWSVAGDAAVTNGSVAGGITGFMTAADPIFYDCGTRVDFDPLNVPPTDIKLLEATANTGVTVAGTDTDADGVPQVAEDGDLNGLPDGVDKYPAFLSSVLPGTHKARYFGHVVAAGLSDLYVNVVVTEAAPGGPYHVTTIVNDPTAPPESATEQFCAPQSLTMTFLGTSADNPGTLPVEGGQAVYRNPATAGAYVFSALLVSEFDLDNDGVSNGLDVCPATANASQADADQDYMGNACDAQQSTADFDVDGDGTENGYDNCIFVANASQADGDFDDLGDACDPNVTVPSGPNHFLTCTDPVGIGQGDPGGASCAPASLTPTPTPSPTLTPTPKDPGGDTDGDTIPNGSDPDDDNDGCTDVREIGSDQALGGRRDPHWYWDVMDQYIGSPLAKDRTVSVGDIGAVVARFGTNGNPGGDPTQTPSGQTGYHTSADRNGSFPGQDPWDLRAPDGVISVGDIGGAVAQFGHSCM